MSGEQEYRLMPYKDVAALKKQIEELKKQIKEILNLQNEHLKITKKN